MRILGQFMAQDRKALRAAMKVTLVEPPEDPDDDAPRTASGKRVVPVPAHLIGGMFGG